MKMELMYTGEVVEKTGLDHKTWNATLDHMLKTSQCNPDTIEDMNGMQRWMINELKKAIKRLRVSDYENNE